MKIYLFDILGVKAGMHYYYKEFEKFLLGRGVDVAICSNYTGCSGGKAYLPYIYAGCIFSKLLKAFVCLLKLYVLVLRTGRHSIVIVSTYGTPVDALLLSSILLSKRVIPDVHEVYSLDGGYGFVRKVFRFIYRHALGRIIIHSSKSRDELKTIGTKAVILEVPHFHYDSEMGFRMDSIGADVQSCVRKEGLNLLMFGTIRPSKGIYELLALIAECEKRILSGRDGNPFNFIIAGQDSGGLVENWNGKHKTTSCCRTVLRRLNDDEMGYLFTTCDYVIIPYNSISQSGVLEAAIKFKKTMITSEIAYFTEILRAFPSFGYQMSFRSTDAAERLQSIIDSDSRTHYEEGELRRYEQRDQFDVFAGKLLNEVV